ncbi:MAG: TraL conjugative transposon family protein [Prolixibacteraceae bacterium]|nr:TraL conjugative transposon family protein [Prolixibacteraceae bacterium]
MKYIKHIFKEIGYSISDFLRRICGGLSPDARITIILSMLLIFTIGNIYFTVSTIYNWGHEDGKKEIPEIQHIDGLEIMGGKNDTINLKDLSSKIKMKRPVNLIDSPIEIQLQMPDSTNNKLLIDNEKRTRKIRPC